MLLLMLMEMLPRKLANIRKRVKLFGARFRIPEQDGTSRLASVSTKAADVNEAKRFANNARMRSWPRRPTGFTAPNAAESCFRRSGLRERPA
jgi:hypothetical protein